MALGPRGQCHAWVPRGPGARQVEIQSSEGLGSAGFGSGLRQPEHSIECPGKRYGVDEEEGEDDMRWDSALLRESAPVVSSGGPAFEQRGQVPCRWRSRPSEGLGATAAHRAYDYHRDSVTAAWSEQ